MTAIRITRAIEAQRAGVAVAIARGDLMEENRRRLALTRMEAREARAERTVAAFHELVERMKTEAAQRGGKAWLASYALDPANGIGDHHLRAADAIRDHMEALASGSCEIRERVDGGNIHNGQMEALVDRRRPGRHTLNAAVDAVTDQRMMPGAMAVIIYDRSIPWALAYCGLSKGSRHYGRMVDAIVEALDAAAARLGIAK
ncbi:hypothetical protein UFOVP399_59 [uncultured Caudovirales phage]|uniref:Uncharacterized protein n=1 Tax=uncultured Caudovirales phage TaxID=2100421 RepID=A0A6J5M7A4_9CAUD|nr:hypothetical protein UFOVP399_59 [uncultured Caudovirales phage]